MPDPIMDDGSSSVRRVLGALAQVIVRAPFAALAVVLALSAVLGYAASKVRINNANDVFFVEDDPALASYRAFQKRFGSDEFVMIYLESEQLFGAEAYKTVRRIVDEMEALTWRGEPVFTHLVSPFHAPTARDEGGTLVIAPVLGDVEAPTAEQLAAAKATMTVHPIYGDLIVNRAGTAGAIVGTLRAMAQDDDLYQAFVAREMAAIVDDEGLDRLGALLVGNPIFKAEVDLRTRTEASTFGSAAVVISLLALFLLLRKKRQVFAAAGVVVLAVVCTIGIMSLLGHEMSLVSIILPLVIVIMGLGAGIHVINDFRHERERGVPPPAAAVNAVRHVGTELVLTTLTTCIGFLTLLTAPVGPLRMLGAYAALGVFLTLVLAVTLVPAVLATQRDAGPGAPTAGDERARRVDAAMNRFFGVLAAWVVAHKRACTLVPLAATLALASGMVLLKVESNMLEGFREDYPFRTAVERVDRALGGTTGSEIIIDTGAPGGVYDPELLRRVAILQQRLPEVDPHIVGATLSVVDLMREIQFAFTGKRDLPETKEQAAQLILLYEASDGETRMVFDHEARRARLSVRMRNATTTRALEFERKALALAEEVFRGYVPPARETVARAAQQTEAADSDTIVILEEEEEAASPAPAAPEPQPPPEPPAPAGQGVQIELTGTGQLLVHLSEYVIQSQVQSFLLAILIIGVLMVALLRNVVLGIVTMVPNLLPIAATYGLMGYLGIPVDFITVIIGGAALGVAVDATIHIASRFQKARAQGISSSESARRVMTSIGRALAVTSAVLVLGFMVVAPSILSSLARFGLLMAFCMAVALVMDLVMTPALLAWFDPGSRGRGRADAP